MLWRSVERKMMLKKVEKKWKRSLKIANYQFSKKK